MTKLTCRALLVAWSVIMCLQLPSFAVQGESGAKALFYDPEAGAPITTRDRSTPTARVRVKRVQPDRVRFAGLHYWIELDGVGPVTTDRVFRTGDRIRIHVRSNVDGYLSLWWLDASGTGKLLFPSSGIGADNHVTADTDFKQPGFIRFSPPADDERLIVFFSRFKADVPEPSGGAPSTEIVARARELAGSKALVFETDNKDPAVFGHYVVNRTGGAVIKEVVLRHR